jgi:hypothetical protein
MALWMLALFLAGAPQETAPKVLTDEAEMVRFAYQRLQFDLKRFAVVEARRDQARAQRKARQEGAAKSTAPSAPAHPAPVITLGPIHTGRLGDILERPYREVVTVPVGQVPAAMCSGIPIGPTWPVGHGFCNLMLKDPDPDAPKWKTVSDALEHRIGDGPFFLTWTGRGEFRPPAAHQLPDIDRAYRALTYASYDIRLRWRDVDLKYKALAVLGPRAGQPFGPKTTAETRKFYILDPVLGFDVINRHLTYPSAPVPEHLLISHKMARQPGQFGIPGDASADIPLCSSTQAAMLCHLNTCCPAGDNVDGECCWLKHPYANLQRGAAR